MTQREDLTNGIALARQYWASCIIEAEKARKRGDLAYCEMQLEDADRKAENIRQYENDLAVLDAWEAKKLEAAE